MKQQNTIEIKPGYKMTKLGWIPEEWEVIKISELTNVKAGGTPSTKNMSFWDGEIKWMSSGELNLRKVDDVKGRITKLGLESSSTHLLPEKCVLIGLAGQGKTRGTVAINFVELCTNQSIAAIFPSKNYVCEFLFFNLLNRYDEIRRMSTGDGGRGGLNLKIIGSIKIPLPPLPEQKKIADILSTWDKSIETTQSLIDKLQLRKKGLMQQLLSGKKRLPGFSGEWDFMSLEKLISTKSEKFNPKESANFKCIELEHIEQQTGRINGFTNSQEQKSTKNKFKAGQVLYGKLRPYLSKFWKAEFQGVCSTEIWVLSIKDKLLVNEFLFYLVQGTQFNNLANATSGSKMPRADWNFMREFEFKIPPLKEQTAIAQVLTKADEEIDQTQEYLEQLKEQKKGLMQQLLTGQRRVVV